MKRNAGIHGRVDTGSCGAAANDNDGAEARVQSAVLTLARLIGRQIAREQFMQQDAANDNRPAGKADRHQDRKEQ